MESAPDALSVGVGLLVLVLAVALAISLWTGSKIRRRQVDHERNLRENRQDLIDAAKGAALSAATDMSSKLLDDFKRESESAKKDSEERIKKTTEPLVEQFQDIVKAVASLNDKVKQGENMMDTVLRALSSPGGAGYFAEIGLENTLKSFGLEPERDFIMHYTIPGESNGKKLRPDAVVFLPGDSVLVIDSKASKFLLELAEAEGTEDEKEAYDNLARTMNQHLRSLTDKDYKTAIGESYREVDRGGKLRNIINVMYLPNEGALEKLANADPSFAQKAMQAGIIPLGPGGLAGLIGVARIQIDRARQAKNQEQIIEATQHLLEGVAVAIGHVDRVGRGIRTAADSFGKLTGSLNTRLLPRARKLVSLGVRPAKSGDLEHRLPSYQVVTLKEDDVIETDAEEIPPTRALENTAKERG